jgi:predicted nucleic-acid-binding Zn-ribbon protein
VSRVEAGSFELIICSACGYTEWYAYDLEGLAKIPGVRLVGPNTENGGPYR